MATWHTRESVRAVDENGIPLWADADNLNDDMLDALLDVAREQVIAYAPALAADVAADAIPSRYVFGQLRQAQNLFAASAVNAGGQIGDGGEFVITPRPLDWHVKGILRPARGRPRVR